jgi:hypothetical protein
MTWLIQAGKANASQHPLLPAATKGNASGFAAIAADVKPLLWELQIACIFTAAKAVEIIMIG